MSSTTLISDLSSADIANIEYETVVVQLFKCFDEPNNGSPSRNANNRPHAKIICECQAFSKNNYENNCSSGDDPSVEGVLSQNVTLARAEVYVME
ncbi:14048_t:CDS:2, partial [Funneliformis caledonium]